MCYLYLFELQTRSQQTDTAYEVCARDRLRSLWRAVSLQHPPKTGDDVDFTNTAPINYRPPEKRGEAYKCKETVLWLGFVPAIVRLTQQVCAYRRFSVFYMLNPPLISITCPVTYADRSLARKRATFATSSGRPPRLRGICFSHS